MAEVSSMYSESTTQTYSFNTPEGKPAEAQCGRVVLSSFHIANTFTGTERFPAECDDAPLTPQ